MKEQRKHSSTSNIHRFKILDNSATDGSGLTGLTSASSGLIISTIADNEATPTTYTVAAGNVETITTLGTYAAPSANKCRFKEVDATNHPGLYEVQFADSRYGVANAKRLIVSISGAANCAETDLEIELVRYDPQDAVRLGLSALPNAAADSPGGLPISDDGGLDMDALAGTFAVSIPAIEADSIADGLDSEITRYRGTDWLIVVDNLATQPTKVYFSIKRNSEADADAVLQANSTDGLNILDGAAAGTPTDAAIAIESYDDGGTTKYKATVTIKPAATATILPDRYRIDFKETAPNDTELAEADLIVATPVTDATS